MKMIVSDFDGTFYHKEILENIEWMKKFQENNLFVIATGRSFDGFKKEENNYNIPTSYIIFNHGASITKNNEVIYNITIENNLQEKLIQELFQKNVIASYACRGKESNIDIHSKNATKLYVLYENSEIAREVWEAINQKYSSSITAFFVDKKSALEIISKNTNKSEAIRFIARKENIDFNEIYTIGDDLNDIEMIQEFHGFAIKNSKQELKEIAEGEYLKVSELIQDVLENKI